MLGRNLVHRLIKDILLKPQICVGLVTSNTTDFKIEEFLGFGYFLFYVGTHMCLMYKHNCYFMGKFDYGKESPDTCKTCLLTV